MRLPAVVDVYEHAVSTRSETNAASSVELSARSADEEVLASAIDHLLDACGRSGATAVELRLHTPLVQIRTLTGLPPVRARDLEALVWNQRSRFFRTVEGEPVVSAMWSAEGSEAVAIAALADRELLDRIGAAVAHGGRRLRRIIPCGDCPQPGIPLRTPHMRAADRARSLRQYALAIVVAMSGWLSAGGAFVFDLFRDDYSISAELDALQEPLSRIQALETTIADFVPIAVAYRRQSPEHAWLMPLLAGIAQSLPGDAHLHRLVASRGNPSVLEVHAPDPVAVVEQLRSWWPGTVRLEGLAGGVDLNPKDGDPLFTVVLEQAS